MKRVMINVDDLGLSDAVNQAVVSLAQMRRIHATSFMSLGRIQHDEVRFLQQQGIEIGLHFDLTAFTDTGNLKTVLLRSYLHGWKQPHLHQLICQQLDAFEDKIQAQPVFVDGHQHVHQFPQIRQMLLQEIQKRYGTGIGIRNTYPIQHDLKAQIIYHLGGRALNQYLLKKPWLYNAAFGGIYHFNPKGISLPELWRQWLTQAKDRTIIMCHPAIADQQWQDDIKEARQAEWHWLSSDAFSACWEQNQCRSWHWRENDNG
ncbi:ChbG/HpnK family deacetylase [Neisseriaceae bacterium ESL0693]|nr:ChbG/HpnK family deacetylase [Neisseriaceae bacterium ESL0693]